MDYDGESIDSANNDELDSSDAEVIPKEDGETVDEFGKDICQLFQAEEDPLFNKAGDTSSPPLSKKEIPQNLLSIVEDCDIKFG